MKYITFINFPSTRSTPLALPIKITVHESLECYLFSFVDFRIEIFKMAISRKNLYDNGKGNIWSGKEGLMMSLALILVSVTKYLEIAQASPNLKILF